MLSARLSKLQHQLTLHHLDGLIVSTPSNLTYLTNFEPSNPSDREALLFLNTHQGVFRHSPLLLPPKFPDKIAAEPMGPAPSLNRLLKKLYPPQSKIGIEANNLTVAELDQIKSAADMLEFPTAKNLVETLRIIKKASEIDLIKQACKITTNTMLWLTSQLQNPKLIDNLDQELNQLIQLNKLTEKQLVQLIHRKLATQGAPELAFPIIVAFNQNSAIPHHIPSDTTLSPNSIILLDFGVKHHGYCADMTRTIGYKLDRHKSRQFQQVEKAVHDSYQLALTSLSSTIKPNAHHLDLITRQGIESAGFSSYPHATGHGLGLDIHEDPRITPNSLHQLQPNMVITLEPSIYLAGEFGYRHEDTILITNRSYKLLTNPDNQQELLRSTVGNPNQDL